MIQNPLIDSETISMILESSDWFQDHIPLTDSKTILMIENPVVELKAIGTVSEFLLWIEKSYNGL